MPVAVVVVLRPVEVEHPERERLLGARAGELALEVEGEGASVGQAGQRIGRRLVLPFPEQSRVLAPRERKATQITSSGSVASTIAGRPTLSKLDQTRIASAASAKISGIRMARTLVLRTRAGVNARCGSHGAAAITGVQYQSGVYHALTW
jgi:hypothetical protein